MFDALARTVCRHRWAVLLTAVLFTVLSAVWGRGVFSDLSDGGFEDPRSESAWASDTLEAAFSEGDELVVSLRATVMTVDDFEYRRAVGRMLERLPEGALTGVTDYWNTGDEALVGEDRRDTYLLVSLRSGELADEAGHERVRAALTSPDFSVELGGEAVVAQETAEQTESDLARAELIALPALAVLLLAVFGSVPAALSALVLGVFAVLGSLTLLRTLAMVTEVSVFSVNVITMLGLGLAVDHSLLVVARFREELARSPRGGTAEAVRTTLSTAGRTVAFSGTTVAAALCGLLLFPQMFLRSVGLGGICAVLFTMAGALVVLPALLAVLGRRIEALSLPWRPRLIVPRHRRPRPGFWRRVARAVNRRPVLAALLVTAVLAALTLPFAGVRFGSVDHRALPEDAESRAVAEEVQESALGHSVNALDVVVTVVGTPDQEALEDYADRLASLPDATGADLTGFSPEHGVVRLSVLHGADPMSDTARELVHAVRAEPSPPGAADVLVGGPTAEQVDVTDSLADHLPRALALVLATTLVLLFAAFGSVLLPVKAVLVAALSLGASFGVMVWVFQDGHLAHLLGFTPTGTTDPTVLVLVLVVAFGLATDYEVFLLSRVRAEWEAGRSGPEAVAEGMHRTGGVITAAALLLCTVLVAFSTAEVAIVKMLGVGLLTAIVLDATLVRMLLVPATMRLMGSANWWLPRPLRAVHARIGFGEEEPSHTPVVSPHPAADAHTPRTTEGTNPWHPLAPTSPDTAPLRGSPVPGRPR
ncbi:MMPL family transporter [Nocardiopsis sp. HNM0947]|uniref:MMPL family transporter n=1 Tax=Nocardiopsis coralli TaxID=2772213 RepID=A0ABR9P878_9ACTN|nr:MMPL family transporter [Nocardiopsis coralli]MBE3000042.1 MMPL family transporter [Nocardiopsis coralli]